ncbi:MFS transporter [Helicobacter sp. MIT 21-1697]|uniref:MFS transporter n=1 Tax=Helicobacter sp. MIT 21-1697 TaxID=2993733 RepID=UPI00224AFBA9|nr:MFS transporter [Helicobacter sp. MIT 21-1697]MCX2716933.1 MFS transporter [Helicobacter sp. MIT 21-1697]
MTLHKKIFFINLLPILLISLNLRAPITSVGPIVELLRDYYHLSAAQAGLLTSLPLFAFGIISFIVAIFQPTKAMFLGLLCILTGEIVRCMGGSVELFIGTAIMGGGIAVANVLLPSFVKTKFPRDVPKIMGIYSLVINISATLGIAAILPLTHILSVPMAMGCWASLAIMAILSYLPQMTNHRISRPKVKIHFRGTLWANLSAWNITLFMGFTSIIGYSFFTWYPSFIISFGYTQSFASNMMILSQMIVIPSSFFAPLILGSLSQERKKIFIGSICGLYMLSFSTLLYTQDLWVIVLVSILLGIPVGGVFGIALLLISSKSANVQIATKLSAMAQGIGYLLACLAPVLIGKLYDLYHNFTYSLITLLCLSVMLNIIGFLAYKSPPIQTP